MALLKKGDVFVLPEEALQALRYETEWMGEKEGYRVVETRLKIDPHSDGKQRFTVLEERPGGWHRHVEKVLGIKATERHRGSEWVVVRTTHDGGGTGHGSGDIFPNGHHVHAVLSGNTNVHLDFFQSGCFIGVEIMENITPFRQVKVGYAINPEGE